MFGVPASKRHDVSGETWEWRSSEPQRGNRRVSRSGVARVLAAVAVASVAWPAGAARRWDDQAVMPAQTLFGWTRATPEIRGPGSTLVELAQKEGGPIVPPVKRQQPQMPTAKEPTPAAEPVQAPPPEAAVEKPKAPAAETTQPAPSSDPSRSWTDIGSIFAPVTDWLAKANREYQGTIVKELSKPSQQEMETQAKQQDDEKAAQAEASRKAEAAAKQAAAEEATRKKAEADAAARKAAEAAAKDAEAKKQAEAVTKDAEAKRQAEAAKEAEAKKPADTAKEAEAKKQAEAAKAAEAAKLAEQKKAAEAEAELRRQREAAKLADEKKLAEEKRQAQLKEELARKEQADAERKVREAKIAEERKAKDEAQARAAADRAQQAAVAKKAPVAAATQPSTSERHRRWTVTIIPEPIERPSAEPVVGRELSLPRVREANAVMLGSRQLSGRMGLGGGSLKGPAVKRWIWRAGTCRFAGRKVSRKDRYTVAQGDSLWRISEKYYDQGGKYPRIYRANRDRINDPDLIYPCQKFRVPRR